MLCSSARRRAGIIIIIPISNNSIPCLDLTTIVFHSATSKIAKTFAKLLFFLEPHKFSSKKILFFRKLGFFLRFSGLLYTNLSPAIAENTPYTEQNMTPLTRHAMDAYN